MFRNLRRDNATYELTVQGSVSKNSNVDVASIVFQNYDDDSKMTYNLASIGARDHYGDSMHDGYGDIVFSTSSGDSRHERVRIQHDGNVGIGTASPGCMLDVVGTARFDTLVTRSLALPAGGSVVVSRGGAQASTTIYRDYRVVTGSGKILRYDRPSGTPPVVAFNVLAWSAVCPFRLDVRDFTSGTTLASAVCDQTSEDDAVLIAIAIPAVAVSVFELRCEAAGPVVVERVDAVCSS